ncbi:MAG: SDR family oxidoreductase [Candidatus Omnitrophica bacterium]|nr:SDR family oxidoreductase [Candidatus Omnitrophota bacterium]
MTTEKRILITGATGFVGLRLFQDLKNPYQIVGTYRGSHPASYGVDWVEFEAEKDNPVDLIDRTQPDVIIHLLALSRTEGCAKEPDRAEAINTRITLELGEVSRHRGIRFIFTSTDQVFDGAKGEYSEEDPPHPTGVYARTKVEAERGLFEMFGQSPELLTVFRLALSYGHSDEKHPGPVGWIINALEKGDPVNLFVDEIRSPLYVGDISRAMNEAIERGHSGLHHLGGGDRIDRHSFGVLIAKKLSLPVELCQARSVKDYPGPEPRSPDCSFNIRHFVDTFGWTPIGIEEGLEKILKDHKK